MSSMHKTTVEIDREALAEAERNLGTRGYKETISRALDEVNRRAALARDAKYLRESRQHLPDPREWAALREPRT
jgi:Arc/MetJ family transcription regulator